MKRHLKMESDTESTGSQSSSTSNRLGKCEVCNVVDAKYTCPKCEVKTCCLKCLTIHKTELKCDGIRDRTKFKPIKKMTKMDFMSDYYFLEECTRYVQDRKNDRIKKFTHYNKSLPTHLFKLRNACKDRNITLRFLLQNFTKHKINTTFYDWKSKVIYWRIEWIFTNASNLQFVDERCSENDQLSKLLDKYLNVDSIEHVPMKKTLEYYQANGIGNLCILLKSEGIKKCKTRYYELDCKKTLKENLSGKELVEFPTIHLCYDDVVNEFDIIDSDDDVENETKLHRLSLDEINRKLLEPKTEEQIKKEEEQRRIRKIQQERRKRREEMKKEPTNYLFGNEFETDSDETEEETDMK